MAKNNIKIEILIKMIESLRLENLELEKAMFRSFFLVLTVSAVFAGIYSDTQIIKDDTARGVLLFGLSQVLFLLVLFAGACFTNLTVHAGHIRSLEKQINKRTGGKLLIWDSEISRRFLFSFRGPFLWAIVILYSFIFCTFAYFMVVTLRITSNKWLSLLIIIELLIVIGLTIFAHFEFKRVENFSNEKYESYIKKRKLRSTSIRGHKKQKRS